MILPPGVKGKKVAVFGLGATGMSAAEALIAAGAQVFTWDESKSAREKTINSEFRAEHPKDWPWKELAFLVLSPGVPLTHPKPHAIVRKAAMEKVEVIGDIELFARALDAFGDKDRPHVIAITGANGKSTTTALIGHILKDAGLKAFTGGNLGTPVLSLSALAPGNIYVLELSSFQLDLAKSLRANVAVLLNISPDHLDRHGDIAGYIAAKKRIFFNQRPEDMAVVGVDDAYAQGVCAELSAAGDRVMAPVSSNGALGRGVFALSARLFYNLAGKTGEAGDIGHIAALRGPHNWQNAAAALAAVMAEGVTPTLAVKSMGRFQGLPHRLEIVGRIGPVTYVNDSKATNADAAERALKSYTDIFWIAGGRPKEGGASALRALMPRVRGAYLIGEAAHDFEGQLAGAVPCIQCGDLAKAVARAGRDAAESGLAQPVVLLSPACASYDQFRNFEERGEIFRRLVGEAARAAGEAA